MYEPLRRRTLAFLKVPAEPHPPAGDPASLRVFRAGRNYFRLRLAGWAATQIVALAGIIFWTGILIGVESAVRTQRAAPTARAIPTPPPSPATEEEKSPPSATPRVNQSESPTFVEKIQAAAKSLEKRHQNGKRMGGTHDWKGLQQFFVEVALALPNWAVPLVWLVKIFSFALYVLQIPFTYALRRLDYEMRWYMVTDRSLRLRHGVWNVSEATMSFANLQQVMVTQGPLQRLLGLADVKVQSAGGGSHEDSHHRGEDMHLGLFHSVSNAPEIRDLILDRLRHFRENGLGDPEERARTAAPAPVPAASSEGASDETIAAARELAAEARALRAALN